jgi:hypothetical protein
VVARRLARTVEGPAKPFVRRHLHAAADPPTVGGEAVRHSIGG